MLHLLIGALEENLSIDKDFHVKNEDSQVKIVLAVPGIKKEDLDVSLNADYLRVSGESEFNKIQKSLYLSDRLEPRTAEATLSDGILTVTLQKSKKFQYRQLDLV